jgi:hypothetical protein
VASSAGVEFTDRTQTGVKCKCVNMDLGRYLSVLDVITILSKIQSLYIRFLVPVNIKSDVGNICTNFVKNSKKYHSK